MDACLSRAVTQRLPIDAQADVHTLGSSRESSSLFSLPIEVVCPVAMYQREAVRLRASLAKLVDGRDRQDWRQMQSVADGLPETSVDDRYGRRAPALPLNNRALTRRARQLIACACAWRPHRYSPAADGCERNIIRVMDASRRGAGRDTSPPDVIGSVPGRSGSARGAVGCPEAIRPGGAQRWRATRVEWAPSVSTTKYWLAGATDNNLTCVCVVD